MGLIKQFFSKVRNIIWLIATVLVIAAIPVVNFLATDYFYDAIGSTQLGKRIPITEAGEGVAVFEKDEGITNKADAFAHANEVNRQICEEGMVLLKNENNALPLNAAAKVSVFGKNSVNLVYGGSGSAAPKQTEPKKTIFNSLTEAGFEFNSALKDFYESSASGSGRSTNPDMDHGGSDTLLTGETPMSSYPTSVTESYSEYGDAALIVFSRIAGEGWDLPRVASDNPDNHYLQLDTNEKALLAHVCGSNAFDHVIVLINSSNMIDLGFLKFADDPAYQSKIDGAIIIGSTGAQGIMALGKILAGTVTPSGHTVDTLYTHYERDPIWQNFGDNRARNSDTYTVGGVPQIYNFVDYEEGIYVGYRYYETRGHIDGEQWYGENVVYPFGYGLSYTTFSEELLNKSALEAANLTKDGEFTVDVKVSNTGTVKGKDVIQLYANAPYTNGGIEKAYKVLVGYAKTKELLPGQEDTVHVTVAPYDFANYDSDDKNGNGFKGYELESGNYTFFVGTSAHDDIDSFTKNLPQNQSFANDPTTDAAVGNLFEDADDHLQENLSRANFTGTFPVMPTPADREVTAQWLADTQDNRDSGNDEVYDTMPMTNAEVTTKLKQLIGKDYNDPLWDTFLNQMSVEEMQKFFNGAYSTAAIERLGVPFTTSFDGPTGIVAFSGDEAIYGTCYYASECLVAMTWNIELATHEGEAIGNEALVGDERSGVSIPYTGWYGPGVNLHRSPFGGRNTEYYSEDPFMSGKCAAAVIKAVQRYGVYANVKHFALNDQETHRDTEGKNYWVNEQAMRELYFKPFEMAVKQGESKGVMSAFTRIGTKWTGGSYTLLTRLLRKEWGFVGTVICDYHVNGYMNNRQMCYAGGDLNLTADKPWRNADSNSIGDVSVLRRSSHNTLFALANSNAMALDIIGYKPAWWEATLYVVEAVGLTALLVGGAFEIWSILKKKKKPLEKAEA